MNFGTILILSFLAGFAYFSRRFMGAPQFERPIVMGPVVGLVMGDVQTGLVVGGTLELIFMGAQAIGGSPPPNVNIGSVLGTAFAIFAGEGLEEALVIAVPAAILGSFFELLAKGISSAFVSWAESFADEANTGGVALAMHLGNLAHFLSNAIPTFLALWLGAEAVQNIMTSIPDWAETGFSVVGGALPALGFALLLSTIASRRFFPFFFVGFLFAVYTGFGVLGVAVLGALVALIVAGYRLATEEMEPAGEAEKEQDLLVSQKEIRGLFWRSFALQSAFSFDRMQSIGFTWSLMPILERLYESKEELSKALRRHLTFFNTHPWIVGPVLALTSTMEAQRARGDEVEVEAIQGIKTGMMGPLAGIGDSLFFGIWRPLMSGISASMALQGNPIAPFVFLIGVNVVHFYARWQTLVATFRRGTQFLMDLESDRMKMLMEGATITGLMAIGALVGTWLGITTPLTYTVQDATVSVQSSLDSIMPKLLPLLTTLGVYWAIRKGYRTWVLLVSMAVFFFVFGALGIFG
jgi:PTS system mannose-specific IID component